MGFLGGFKWEENPGHDAATGAIDSAIAGMDDFGSKGRRFAKRILKGLMHGDTSLIGNPFAAGAGAAKREIDSNLDPFLPPELAAAQARVAKARVDEQSGNQFENYVRGMAMPAADLTERAEEFEFDERNDLARTKADVELGGYKGRETKGWGAAVGGALLGAAQAASGLGYKPFARTS